MEYAYVVQINISNSKVIVDLVHNSNIKEDNIKIVNYKIYFIYIKTSKD